MDALRYLREFKNIKWYDPYLIKPEPYDMKAQPIKEPPPGEQKKKVKKPGPDGQEAAEDEDEPAQEAK
jgi:hypothetical protein